MFTTVAREVGRGLLSLTAVLCGLLGVVSCSQRSPESESYLNLIKIGAAIQHYREEQPGSWPGNLDALIGRQLKSNEVACFFPAYTDELHGLAGQNVARQIEAVKADRTAYYYFGAAGAHEDIIMAEKTNLWLRPGFRSTFNDGKVNVLRADFTVRRMATNEVLERLSRLIHASEPQR